MSKVVKIKVSAGAKTEKVEEMEDGSLKVRVMEAPEKGKANKRVLELVAKYFGAPISKVFLVSGQTYREKVVEVDI